jgi:hypothetical protein
VKYGTKDYYDSEEVPQAAVQTLHSFPAIGSGSYRCGMVAIFPQLKPKGEK